MPIPSLIFSSWPDIRGHAPLPQVSLQQSLPPYVSEKAGAGVIHSPPRRLRSPRSCESSFPSLSSSLSELRRAVEEEHQLLLAPCPQPGVDEAWLRTRSRNEGEGHGGFRRRFSDVFLGRAASSDIAPASRPPVRSKVGFGVHGDRKIELT